VAPAAGARRAERLAGHPAAEAVRLTAGQRERLDQASGPPLFYSSWPQAQTGRGRLSPASPALLAPQLR
jgi:hypothetical protein